MKGTLNNLLGIKKINYNDVVELTDEELKEVASYISCKRDDSSVYDRLRKSRVRWYAQSNETTNNLVEDIKREFFKRYS